MDDRTAISRLKQGDFKALDALVTHYQVQAVHAAYLILRDRDLSEEVAQNAFLKAAERIHQFDEERPFGPWFFRIVVNDAVKLAKKRQRNLSLDEHLDSQVARAAEWLKDPSLPPDQLLEQKEIRTVILDAIQTLAPEQRAVIVMRYFLEMSEADMSARMDRLLSTIKWWLREARKRLRGASHASHWQPWRQAHCWQLPSSPPRDAPSPKVFCAFLHARSTARSPCRHRTSTHPKRPLSRPPH